MPPSIKNMRNKKLYPYPQVEIYKMSNLGYLAGEVNIFKVNFDH